ncbi:type III-A CRISPR-associated protein Csm2 [Nitrosomonas communis]|uniref:CRISPR system Cms protein Csm2 n=1 Tax=Nitrosomonas communis TaxID=44574 RepID=A0A1I4RMM8_9PROT|nr:type III-A CRISPR-associated protein Csm2 [Nitrosomonas communis]SFM53484.1 CRISPR-associated protein Csm2 [Nitrosomonas communis]
MSYSVQGKASYEKYSAQRLNDSRIKDISSKFLTAFDTVPGELFDTWAEEVANELAEEGKAGSCNKSTQIRHFYDELVSWEQRIKDDEAFKKWEPFLRMMNAKVAYAKGRKPKLVGDKFELWLKEGVKATTSAKTLHHFKLHFEAVLGFLKGLGR